MTASLCRCGAAADGWLVLAVGGDKLRVVELLQLGPSPLLLLPLLPLLPAGLAAGGADDIHVSAGCRR